MAVDSDSQSRVERLERVESDDGTSKSEKRQSNGKPTRFFIEDILSPSFGPPACRAHPPVPGGAPHPKPPRDRGGSKGKDAPSSDNPLLPAWVFCTRYSDRPSSGPRMRKVRRRDRKQEEKRPRTAFTSEQLERLRREFDSGHYLTEWRRRELALELALSESQIKIWFQNKRAKLKKARQGSNALATELQRQGLYNHSTVTKTKIPEEW